MHDGVILAANALIKSLSAFDHCKIQCVQNNHAKIITDTTKYLNITPVRKTLHCLPIDHYYLMLSYWCASFYKVDILNILNFFSKLDTLCLFR